MGSAVGWLAVIAVGAAAIIGGAELFAEHLAAASKRLGVSSFALALLLAGAEPEELATVVTASVRGADGVGFGDVIGANATMVTLALAAGASAAPLPFGPTVRRYALAGLGVGVLATALSWDGVIARWEGLLLVLGYAVFVGAIWLLERRPPALGEVSELAEEGRGEDRRLGVELGLVLGGLVLLSVGSVVLVEAVRRLTGIETTQTRLGLTVVGFATAAELVVLARATARRGITEAAVAGIVGSYVYNMTMSLGVGALADPLAIADPGLVRGPGLVTVALLAAVLARARHRGGLGRVDVVPLVAGYGVFVAVALWG